MDHLDPHLVIGQLLQGCLHSLHAALNIGLDDDGQLLDLALGDLAEQAVERHLVVCLELFFLCRMLSLLYQLSCQPLIRNRIEDIPGAGHFCQTGDLHRHRGACALDYLAPEVGHDPDSAHSSACNDHVPGMQGTVLHQQGSDGASALVQSALDDGALRPAVGVCLQFLYLCYQQDVLQQLVNALSGLCRNRHTNNVAAPFLADQLMLGQLLLDPLRIGAFLIDLVDGNDDGHSCRLGVVDGFYGLGHDAVVRCHH